MVASRNFRVSRDLRFFLGVLGVLTGLCIGVPREERKLEPLRLRIFMMSVLFNPMVAAGLEPNVAWRVSMVVPAVMFVLCAICMKFMRACLFQQFLCAFGPMHLWIVFFLALQELALCKNWPSFWIILRGLPLTWNQNSLSEAPVSGMVLRVQGNVLLLLRQRPAVTDGKRPFAK